MKLKKIRKVTFDDLTHSYWANGKELIGVTTLMKKHNLSPDYSMIPKEVLDNAAAKGTELHKLLEDYDNGLPYHPCTAIQMYSELGKKHVASEYLVSDGETVASFIDKVYETENPNVVEIADIKTTSELHVKSVAWQLGIYAYLFERQNPGLKVGCCSVLWFDKNTQRLKSYQQIVPASREEVIALLEAEKKGETYQSVEVTKDISLILSEPEILEYLEETSKIAEIKQVVESLTVKVKDTEARILKYMLENGDEEIQLPNGSLRIKKPYLRSSIDSARLKKEHSDIYEKYLKTTEVGASLIFKSN